MDHAEARELLELAAIERGGLDRLMAGDTRDAATLAAHLAGCAECTAEVERVRRASAIVRAAVREAPPVELRERTLAQVRAVGRPRTAGAGGASGAGATALVGALPEEAAPAGDGSGPGGVVVPLPVDRTGDAEPAAAELAAAELAAASAPSAVLTPAPAALATPRPRPPTHLVQTAIAAVVLLAVVALSAFATLQIAGEIEMQRDTAAALGRANVWTLRIEGRPDSERVELASPAGATAQGTLVFSPATTEMVVVATGLPEPPEGESYHCWVEIDGQRHVLGPMYLGGGVAYWNGRSAELAEVEPGATFGVSSVPDGGPISDAEAVLVGTL